MNQPSHPITFLTNASLEQRQVGDFMLTFRQYVSPVPTYLNFAQAEVRLKVMSEEMNELRLALRTGLVTDVVDALVDVLYTVYGTANAMGINLRPFFDEVHQNNMKKYWTFEQIKTSMPQYSVAHGLEPGKFVVLCEGKVIKPPGHPKPNFVPILDAQVKAAPQ